MTSIYVSISRYGKGFYDFRCFKSYLHGKLVNLFLHGFIYPRNFPLSFSKYREAFSCKIIIKV